MKNAYVDTRHYYYYYYAIRMEFILLFSDVSSVISSRGEKKKKINVKTNKTMSIISTIIFLEIRSSKSLLC